MSDYDQRVRRQIDQMRALLGVPRDRTAFSDDRAAAIWVIVLLLCAGAGALTDGAVGAVAGSCVAVVAMWGIGAMFHA